jgi:hypothetical protein
VGVSCMSKSNRRRHHCAPRSNLAASIPTEQMTSEESSPERPPAPSRYRSRFDTAQSACPQTGPGSGQPGSLRGSCVAPAGSRVSPF